MGEKDKQKHHRKSSQEHLKEKGWTQPTFVPVKTLSRTRMDAPFRVVNTKDLKPDGSIVIDKSVYFRVVGQEPTANAQSVRDFCDLMNKQAREARERKFRAQKAQYDRVVRRVVLVRNLMMDEVLTGKARLSDEERDI